MEQWSNEGTGAWLDQVYDRILGKMEQECARMGDKIPYIPKEGVYGDYGSEDIAFWTNGFWGGMMWQLYSATGDERYADQARNVEKRLDLALAEYTGLHHDVGFMWLHTAVADYRMTKSEEAKVRGLHAAGLLCGRYNSGGQFISAWNENRPGWIIIDSLMNLPLLYWASEETKDPRYCSAACGLLEISSHVGELEKAFYEQGALAILKVVEERFCDWDTSRDGIVGHGTVAYHRQGEIHVPIIYGDYFFIEAILKLKGKGMFIW